jgi:hypothetical protein
VGGFDTSGRGEEVGKGCRRVNTVHILYTHVCQWKNDTRNYSRNGGGVIKENGGGEFKYDIFDIL